MDVAVQYENTMNVPQMRKETVKRYIERYDGLNIEQDFDLPPGYEARGEYPNHIVQKLGQTLLEGYCQRRKHAFFGPHASRFISEIEPVIEAWQEYDLLPQKLTDKTGHARKETLQLAGNHGLYTTMVMGIVERPLRAECLGPMVYRPLPGFVLKGHNSAKIPLMVDNTAADLGDDTAIADTSTAFSSTTVTLKWAYSMTRVTQPLLEVSAIEILVANLESMGYALARHQNTDIVADLVTSTPSGGANDNYKALGGATYLTFDALNTELGLMKGVNNSIPNKAIIHWTDYHKFINDDDLRPGMIPPMVFPGADLYGRYGGNLTRNGKYTEQCGKLLGMDLFASNALTSKQHFMVDSDEYGWWLVGNPLAVLDYQPTGFLATDIVAWLSYKPAASKVKAAYRIMSNT